MPDRLDFEARLQALRAPAAAAPPPPPTSAPRPSPASPTSYAAPPASYNASPPTVYSPPTAPAPAAPVTPVAAAVPVSAPTPTPPPSPAIDIGSILGPTYTRAIATAQRAVELERQRHVQDAIASYIQAGQALITLGRQQSMPALQDSLKNKALELLQRAEGLDAWVTSITEQHPGEATALHDAFTQSQEHEDKTMKDTERMVSQIRKQNDEMTARLDKVAMLMKVRSRFMRVVSDRRNRESQRALKEGERQNPSDVAQNAAETTDAESHQERQKRAVVNELHAFIGLPKIDRLRVFKPLSADAAREKRLGQLESDLDEARVESERLRAALKDMEEALLQADASTRQHSLREEQEKEQLAAELARIKDELEMERRMSSHSRQSHSGSWDIDEGRLEHAASDRDHHQEQSATTFEDVAMMNRLRASLQLESTPTSQVPPPRTLEKQESDDGGMWV